MFLEGTPVEYMLLWKVSIPMFMGILTVEHLLWKFTVLTFLEGSPVDHIVTIESLSSHAIVESLVNN